MYRIVQYIIVYRDTIVPPSNQQCKDADCEKTLFKHTRASVQMLCNTTIFLANNSVISVHLLSTVTTSSTVRANIPGASIELRRGIRPWRDTRP